jgi:hypothetical protein
MTGLPGLLPVLLQDTTMHLLKLSAGVCLLAAASVWASTSFDPLSATGQVSARDVQNVLGWTDAEFQQRARAVSFSYRTTGDFTATCSGLNAQGGRVEEPRLLQLDWQAPLNSMVRIEPRNPGRIEGFQLLGLGHTSDPADTTPVSGAACTGANGLAGTWVNVLPRQQTHALTAHFGGQAARLPF